MAGGEEPPRAHLSPPCPLPQPLRLLPLLRNAALRPKRQHRLLRGGSGGRGGAGAGQPAPPCLAGAPHRCCCRHPCPHVRLGGADFGDPPPAAAAATAAGAAAAPPTPPGRWRGPPRRHLRHPGGVRAGGGRPGLLAHHPRLPRHGECPPPWGFGGRTGGFGAKMGRNWAGGGWSWGGWGGK